MPGATKLSITIADPDLLAWARLRSRRTGVSLSAVFLEAVRLERQAEARAAYLDDAGPDGRASPAEMAAIRAEWGQEAVAGPPPSGERRRTSSRPRSARQRTR